MKIVCYYNYDDYCNNYDEDFLLLFFCLAFDSNLSSSSSYYFCYPISTYCYLSLTATTNC